MLIEWMQNMLISVVFFSPKRWNETKWNQLYKCLLRDADDYGKNMKCGWWNCTNIDNHVERTEQEEMQVMDVRQCK